MRNLFVAAGDMTWGSSRLRCYWPAEYMQGTDVIVQNKSTIPLSYKNYIFQKFADADTLRVLKEQGKKTYLDLCDPTWWWQPEQVQECLAYLDGVICCTDALAQDFYDTYGILPKVIPDRLELEHYSHVNQRVHSEVLPIRFIWYGVAVNRVGIFAALANLERLVANGYDIELTIMDNQPEQPFLITDMFPIYHVKWSLAQEVEIITSHDIALLGEYPGAWGRMKSNNRELTAWACGLPATIGDEYTELDILMDWRHRDLQQEMNNERLESEFDVKQSALEWEQLLEGGDL